MGRKYYLDPETGDKIYIRDKAPSMKYYRKAAEQDVIDAKKTEKTQIDFDGEKFTLNGEVLNYKELHDIHLVKPDFAFVVYGDRAYLLSYVQDDPEQMREMRWESSIATNTAVKTSGIYVVSNDGVEIAGVSIRDINSENQGNKVNELTEANKNSTVNYPSNAAVTKVVDEAVAGMKLTVEDETVPAPSVSGGSSVDNTLSVEGAAADAAKVGEEIAALKSAMGGIKFGVTNGVMWVEYESEGN